MEPSFEFTGPPLADIQHGFYDLEKHDGSRVVVIVARGARGPDWTPLGVEVAPSLDWSTIRGAIQISYDEAIELFVSRRTN